MTNTEHGPGIRLRRFAERTLERQTLERVVLPALADLQHECREDADVSRLVRLRAYWGLWKTLAICFIGGAARDREGYAFSLGTRTLLFSVLLLILVAAPSATWYVTFGRDHGVWRAATAGLLYLPSTLIVVLPAAFFLAVALFRTTSARLPTLIRAATAGAVVCATVLFVGAMFVVPTINQSYRQFVFHTLRPDAAVWRPVLSKGLTELTWTELNASIRTPASGRQEELARAHRQQRFALVASAFVVALLGLGVAGRWRSRLASSLAAAVLLGLYVWCFDLAANAGDGGVVSAYGVWTANCAFAILGLRLLRSRKDWGDVAGAGLAE